MSIDETRLADVCERYGVGRLLVFDSVARGTADPASDVDVLYELLSGRRIGWEIEDLADELVGVVRPPGRPRFSCGLARAAPRCRSGRGAAPVCGVTPPPGGDDRGCRPSSSFGRERPSGRVGRRSSAGDALLWNFTVLGEASAQLAADLKQRFAEIRWRQPSRLRNRIVHGYWSIDLDVLHATAQDQLPGFVAELREVLATVIAEDGEP